MMPGTGSFGPSSFDVAFDRFGAGEKPRSAVDQAIRVDVRGSNDRPPSGRGQLLITSGANSTVDP
jgi:hypothetical protein